MNYRSLTVVVFSAKTMLHKPLFINIYDHCKCIFITQPLNPSISTVLPTLHFSPSVSFLSDPRLESLLPSLLLFKIIQKSQKITASSTLKWKILWKGSWKSDIEAQSIPCYSTIRWQKAFKKKKWESYDCKPYHFSIPVGHTEWCQKKLVNQIKTAVKKAGANYTPQIVEEMVPILTIQSQAYLFGSISKIRNIVLNFMLFSEKTKTYRNNQKL